LTLKTELDICLHVRIDIDYTHDVPLIISLTGLVTIHLLLACHFNLIMHIFFPYVYTLHACAPSLFILPFTRSLIDDPEFAMLRSRSEDIAGPGVL